jgi:oligopeptide/dipeptide ABC transporter ATP-binding protein
VPSPQHRGTTLAAIPGRVPSLLALPPGCKYADRCDHAAAVCVAREPSRFDVGGSRVRCFLYDDSLSKAEKPHADWAKQAVSA